MNAETINRLRYHGCEGYENLKSAFGSYVGTDQKTRESIYELPDDFPTEDQIVLACIWSESYEGGAWVVWQKDGQLYEWEGSHCSCYGLDECWGTTERPQAKTTMEAIALRKGENFAFRQAQEDDGLRHVTMDALLEGHLLRGPLTE